MSDVIEKIKNSDTEGYMFECPGCKRWHVVYTKGPNHPNWHWNGSLKSPTFTPSLLVQALPNQEPNICHSFITDGKIKFLSDCTHEHAGKTLDLPEIKPNSEVKAEEDLTDDGGFNV